MLNIYHTTFYLEELDYGRVLGGEPKVTHIQHEHFVTARDEHYVKKAIRVAHPAAKDLIVVYAGRA